MPRNRQQNIIVFVLFLSAFSIFIPVISFALCPVCTVAAAGGVGLSRWLGIDDTISGIWLGGLIVSLAIWSLSWLDKKNIKFKFRSFLVLLLFYLITLFPIYQMNLIGHSCNQLWGVDKLILGIIFGSLIFSFGVLSDILLRRKNNGKVYFYFQKVAIPISFLIISSVIFYFITKC